MRSYILSQAKVSIHLQLKTVFCVHQVCVNNLKLMNKYQV